MVTRLPKEDSCNCFYGIYVQARGSVQEQHYRGWSVDEFRFFTASQHPARSSSCPQGYPQLSTTIPIHDVDGNVDNLVYRSFSGNLLDFF